MESLNVIDTHAHLDMSHFDVDRELVIARASEAGVRLINTIGIDVESSRRAVSLAEKYPQIAASVGIHPGDASKVERKDIDQLEEIAGNPRVVAIGEMGMDLYRDPSLKNIQLQVFKWQLELAEKAGKPIIIHCRQAQEIVLPILEEWTASHPAKGNPRGVLHCFNGDLTTAKKYIEMDFFIALGAYIGYPSSSQLREVVKNIPDEKLVIETDCPFLPPQKLRGKRNEPSYILATLGVLAEIKGWSLQQVAALTMRNSIKLFDLSRFL